MLNPSNAAVFGSLTVSLPPCRSGLCVQTFFGHDNACNSVDFALRGDLIVSADADGVVRLWDVRKVEELSNVQASESPVNSVRFPAAGGS